MTKKNKRGAGKGKGRKLLAEQQVFLRLLSTVLVAEAVLVAVATEASAEDRAVEVLAENSEAISEVSLYETEANSSTCNSFPDAL